MFPRTAQAVVEHQDVPVRQLRRHVLPVEPILRIRERVIAARAAQPPLDRLEIGADRNHLAPGPHRHDHVAARPHLDRIRVRHPEFGARPSQQRVLVAREDVHVEKVERIPNRFRFSGGRIPRRQHVGHDEEGAVRRDPVGRIRRSPVRRRLPEVPGVLAWHVFLGDREDAPVVELPKIMVQGDFFVAEMELVHLLRRRRNFPQAAGPSLPKQVPVRPLLDRRDQRRPAFGHRVVPNDFPFIVPEHDVGLKKIAQDQILRTESGRPIRKSLHDLRQRPRRELAPIPRPERDLPIGPLHADEVLIRRLRPQPHDRDVVVHRRLAQPRPKSPRAPVAVLDLHPRLAAQTHRDPSDQRVEVADLRRKLEHLRRPRRVSRSLLPQSRAAEQHQRRQAREGRRPQPNRLAGLQRRQRPDGSRQAAHLMPPTPRKAAPARRTCRGGR